MYHKSKLSNGATLLLAPQPETQAVTVLILLPVGSRYEAPSVNGASHFVEHLLFKGTTKRPTSLDISKSLDSIGAEYNAFTGKDHTGYYIKLPGDKIELAFDVLSDMLFNSLFDATEIEKERGVIVEEINMYDDNPLLLAGNVFEETLFANHQLGQFIAGPRQVIRTISRAQLVGFKNKFYYPANMTIAVAGNAKVGSAKKLAQKYFGQRAARPKASAFRAFRARQSKPRVSVVHKPTSQVQIVLGVPAYGMTHPKLPALHLLSVILGGNMSSRLFVRVREQHGLAYSVRSDVEAYQDVGGFAISAGLDVKRLPKAIELILEELRLLREKGVSTHELAEAKQFIRGKMVLALEDSEHLANFFARQQTLVRKILTPAERLKQFDHVTVGDVGRVAADIINLKRMNLIVVGPFKDKRPFEKLLA